MIDKINAFLASANNWVSAISLIVSASTLITMLCFNRKLRKAFEKKDFDRDRSKILKKLSGFSDSLLDGIYTEKFLEEIDLLLIELATSYTFLNKKLLVYIRFTSFQINHFYKKESKNGINNSRHKLSAKLRRILVLIRKD